MAFVTKHCLSYAQKMDFFDSQYPFPAFVLTFLLVHIPTQSHLLIVVEKQKYKPEKSTLDC